jgi:hypothetical protein
VECELIEDGSEKVKTGFDFKVRIISFNDRRDDGEIMLLGTDIMRRRYLRNIDIYS